MGTKRLLRVLLFLRDGWGWEQVKPVCLAGLKKTISISKGRVHKHVRRKDPGYVNSWIEEIHVEDPPPANGWTPPEELLREAFASPIHLCPSEQRAGRRSGGERGIRVGFAAVHTEAAEGQRRRDLPRARLRREGVDRSEPGRRGRTGETCRSHDMEGPCGWRERAAKLRHSAIRVEEAEEAVVRVQVRRC
ncbi:MAG: hypothetical protein M1330_05275 [Armatimonadetes bacterium]|nr:hypothetical protein [Armatimonadota bacterium]